MLDLLTKGCTFPPLIVDYRYLAVLHKRVRSGSQISFIEYLSYANDQPTRKKQQKAGRPKIEGDCDGSRFQLDPESTDLLQFPV